MCLRVGLPGVSGPCRRAQCLARMWAPAPVSKRACPGARAGAGPGSARFADVFEPPAPLEGGFSSPVSALWSGTRPQRADAENGWGAGVVGASSGPAGARASPWGVGGVAFTPVGVSGCGRGSVGGLPPRDRRALGTIDHNEVCNTATGGRETFLKGVRTAFDGVFPKVRDSGI